MKSEFHSEVDGNHDSKVEVVYASFIPGEGGSGPGGTVSIIQGDRVLSTTLKRSSIGELIFDLQSLVKVIDQKEEEERKLREELDV